jgi:hypothetical protein
MDFRTGLEVLFRITKMTKMKVIIKRLILPLLITLLIGMMEIISKAIRFSTRLIILSRLRLI